jgi:opacity protein-like surface antigen
MNRKWLLPLFLILTFISLSLCISAGQQAFEWKLEVSAESAQVHLKPDVNSPVVATVPRGTILKSYVKEGEWFRVIPEPDQEGVVSIGYIAPADVTILEKKTQKGADYWQPQTERFRGIGLTVKISGGMSTVARSDIDRGALGIFDSGVASLISQGFTMFSKTTHQFRSRYTLGADMIFRLSSRLGIGIGAEHMRTSSEYYEQFGRNPFQTNTLGSNPNIDSTAIRLVLQYEFPLSKLLEVYINGGPSLNLADYALGFSSSAGGEFEDTMVQDAKGRALGLWGGAGLEITLNSRVGFFLEAQGRYGKINDFKGSEISQRLFNYQTTSSRTEGSLYLLEGEEFPRLAILTDPAAAGQNARKVAFDLTGVSLMAGIKFRF